MSDRELWACARELKHVTGIIADWETDIIRYKAQMEDPGTIDPEELKKGLLNLQRIKGDWVTTRNHRVLMLIGVGSPGEASWQGRNDPWGYLHFSRFYRNFPQNLPFVSANRNVNISARLYPAEAYAIPL